MTIGAIMLNPRDNVATALEDLAPETVVEIGCGEEIRTVTMREAVSFGHKFATEDLAAGTPVRKYGEVIGRTTAAIARGAHAHVHNIESLRGRGDLEGGHEG